MKEKSASTKTTKQLDLQTVNVPIINTWYKRQKPVYKGSNLPSLTQPNMSLSMREILDRFSRGQSIPRKTDGYYSDEDIAELEKLDPFEKMDLAHSIREDIKEQQKILQTPPQTKTKPNEPESHEGESVPKSDPKNESDKK